MKIERRELATTKAEETRDRILDAALALFRDRGFEKTTMRDIAAEAEVATGAAYYYYRTKEDLVMAFYLRTDLEAGPALEESMASTRDLKKRVRGIIDLKFDQFREHRALLTALLKAGIDPRERLSPFGQETRSVREDNIEWYSRALDGSSTSIPADLRSVLPRLLWMLHMALIYHWIIDETSKQTRTRRVVDASVELAIQLIRAASLPFMGPLRKRALTVIRAIEGNES